MQIGRRQLLQSLLAARAVSASATPAGQQHHQIVPRVATAADIRLPAIQAALSQPCRNPKGFDPARFSRTFERGVVRRQSNGSLVRVFRLQASDADVEVAPGIMIRAWTYDGSVPGPTLRCTEGDRVIVHFENASVSDHTIHFHGVHAANMDGVVEVVRPGEQYTYEFTAEPAGLHLYHCHVPPVALHMSRGLFGVFIIDPIRPRPPASEFVLVSHGWDLDFDGRNDSHAYNGPANFYRDNPIEIAAGERIRFYLVNAVEYDPVTSFHLHGNFFETFRTGWSGQPHDRTDIVTLGQAERCIIEFAYTHEGRFMFHPHQNGLAEGGCMGHLDVTPFRR